MQAFNTRHKLDIHRNKIVALLAMFIGFDVCSQNNPTDYLPDYDDHFVHYGFMIGVHSAKYRIQYADVFETPQYDTLHSIVPGNLAGFKLGFVINFHLFEYLDFRILPTVGFYENDLTYRFRDLTEIRHFRDATVVEIPLLLKYKSQRRGNYRMYLLGGLKPSFEAVGRGHREDSSDKLDLERNQVNIEVGVGFDIYSQLFKFSPEIRYSYGLKNMLVQESESIYNAPLKKLTTHNLTVYFTFEGGPSTLRSGSKRRPSIKSGMPREIKKSKAKGHFPYKH